MDKKNDKKLENKRIKRKKKHKILKAFLIFILIVFLFCAGFIGYSTYKNGWGIKGLIQTAMGQDEKKLKDLKPFTVLILGVSKDISTDLTDTIMVASYNPKTQKATLLSIPRDTFVGNNKNKATSYDKINALYQKSPEKTLEAVNKLTGLDIKYYVVISNNALVELVDTIGGVEFDVPIKMDYDDSSQDLYIHLDKGYQKLNGEQAEWLVRFRHNNNGSSYPASYGDNDLGRMRTQREFLKVVAKKVIQLKNITKIGNFIEIFKKNVTTNINDWNIIHDYIPYALDFNTENLQTATLPGDAGILGASKLWFFIASEKQTKTLVNELFKEQNGTEEDENQEQNKLNSNNTSSEQTTSEKKANKASNSEQSNNKENNTDKKSNSAIKIEILNGSNNGKLLTQATENLKKQGYTVYKTGTTTLTNNTTIINKKSVDENTTNIIKEILGTGNIQTSSSTSSSVDITIILGKDYK